MIEFNDIIGAPYKIGCSGPNTFDCKGLCIEVYKRLGRILPRHHWVPSRFERLVRPESWCLVAFQIWDNTGSDKWHVGVVLENCQQFIHTSKKTGVCIPQLRHPLWNLLFEGFYKYVG